MGAGVGAGGQRAGGLLDRAIARSAVVDGLLILVLTSAFMTVVRIVFPLALALVFAITLANLINFFVVVVRASPMERQRKTKQGPDNHRPTRAQ